MDRDAAPGPVATVVSRRFRSALARIDEGEYEAARRELRAWYVGVDLTPIGLDVVQRTSDLVRKASAHLEVRPTAPRIATAAVAEALRLWTPGEPRGAVRTSPKRSEP